jgi:hypothetical protein
MRLDTAQHGRRMIGALLPSPEGSGRLGRSAGIVGRPDSMRSTRPGAPLALGQPVGVLERTLDRLSPEPLAFASGAAEDGKATNDNGLR